MPSRKTAQQIAKKLPQAVAAPYPGFIEPARPNLQNKAPSGARWIHEIKWDGYRMQMHLVDGCSRIYSRPGNDWMLRFPSIMAALPGVQAKTVILDGELIIPNERGGDFNAMQNSITGRMDGKHQFQVFDVSSTLTATTCSNVGSSTARPCLRSCSARRRTSSRS